MITPTNGRVVWYHRPDAASDAQPLAAIVAHVVSDDCVNLAIFNEDGGSHAQTNVTLAQDRPAQPGECEWMPYQKGQAAKTEQASTSLHDRITALEQGVEQRFSDALKALEDRILPMPAKTPETDDAPAHPVPPEETHP